MSVGATVQEETANFQEYIKKIAPPDVLLSESLRQLKPRMEEEPERLLWKDKLQGMMCTAAKLKRCLPSEKHTND